jgi:ankyrin repeat protein
MLSYRFRWVYCQLEILRQCLPPSVRRILDELPETLDETYERVLKDIKKVNRDHAIRLLHCLTVAIRPLRVEELAEVLAVDFDAARQEGIPKLNPNWRWTDQHQAVLSTCSSLIAIVDDGDSQVVQFSHFSVKEYLTSDRLAKANGDVSRYHILPESAHTILAQACLGVLFRFDAHVDEETAKDIPLAEYAAKHWVDHAQFKDVSSHIWGAMEYFFDADKPHFAAWHQVHDIDRGSFGTFFMPRGGPLYYASLCGFYQLVKHLVVKHPKDVNTWGGQMVSPLGVALYRGYLQVAELLYEHGADVCVRGSGEWTLLHFTSEGWEFMDLADASEGGGLVDATRWLLNHGADANAQDHNGWTPLLLAAESKHLEIVQMLLEHHADIHARNPRGEVALHLAVCGRDGFFGPHYQVNLNILQSLLDHGADVNIKDNEGSTPLHHSSFRNEDGPSFLAKGTVEGTRLLLEHGANVDAENNKGDTPFLVALEAGNHEMAEFLWGFGTMLA